MLGDKTNTERPKPLISWAWRRSRKRGSMISLDLPHRVAKPVWFEIREEGERFVLRAWGAGGAVESRHKEEHLAVEAAEAHGRKVRAALIGRWVADLDAERALAMSLLQQGTD